ncbi:MAG TPA: hypothetical protein VJ984_11910 [Xanthomonadales bacterium]|nr:hypothetical protein [Xanthomonadales bacterium]
MNASTQFVSRHFERSNVISAFKLALLILPVVLLTACATTGGGSGGGPVAKRAQDRWDAVLANDFETAYQYYSPGFRSSQTRGDFELSMRLRKVQFRNADYQDQSCEEDVCTLKFSVGYQIASPVPGLETWESKTTLEEKWVRTQGEWWYYPED